MDYGFTTAAYVVAAVLFVLSLGGLSGQESAKRAVWYGIAGMALAVAATLYGPGAGNWLISLFMIAVVGAIGWGYFIACIVYLLFRQATSALGLTSIAGHPQTVRPLVAPMALAAAEQQHGELDEETSETVKAHSAATDNVGLFFGEDIFIAIGSIILIIQTLEPYGYSLRPFDLAVWAIPTAIIAFVIHSVRLLLLDRRLRKRRP